MIVVDIETTGLYPGKNDMVSIGAINFNTGQTFYEECRVYDNTVINPHAMLVNGFSEAQIKDYKKRYPHDVASSFFVWMNSFPEKERLLAGQQVGSFDVPFIRFYLGKMFDYSYEELLVLKRTVDLHSVAFARFGESLSLDGILTKLGLEPEPKPHNALTGAELEYAAFKILLGDLRSN